MSPVALARASTAAGPGALWDGAAGTGRWLQMLCLLCIPAALHSSICPLSQSCCGRRWKEAFQREEAFQGQPAASRRAWQSRMAAGGGGATRSLELQAGEPQRLCLDTAASPAPGQVPRWPCSPGSSMAPSSRGFRVSLHAAGGPGGSVLSDAQDVLHLPSASPPQLPSVSFPAWILSS